MIRPLCPKDISHLRKLHEQSGFAWDFPADFSGFLSAQVYTDENDLPVMLIAARPIAEVVGVFSHEWENPATRMEALREMYAAVESDVRRTGIREVVSWLPPEVARSFGRRLRQVFGWVPHTWIAMCGWIR